MAKNKQYHRTATWVTDGSKFSYVTQKYDSGIYVCISRDEAVSFQGVFTPKGLMNLVKAIHNFKDVSDIKLGELIEY